MMGNNPVERPRFLSEADCRDVLARLARFTEGGGHTTVAIWSRWTGNVRWARNQVTTSGDVRDNIIIVQRNLNGAVSQPLFLNQTSDAALLAAARQAERLARTQPERPQSELITRQPVEPLLMPKLFSDATYQLDAGRRAAAARELVQSAVTAGMLSAGYIEVSAHSLAVLDTYGRMRYFPYTQAQYSVTVRDPKGSGSGWAGVDWYDWSKIDGQRISQLALEKCLKSRNPVAIEPGRYTVILEPQAVADFAYNLVGGWRDDPDFVSREWAEEVQKPSRGPSPYDKTFAEGKYWDQWGPRYSKLGDRVIDARLSVSTDLMDPALGCPPFDLWRSLSGAGWFDGPVYHPATWIKDGVLVNLAYERPYAVEYLRQNTGQPNPGAFRMSVTGPTSTIDEMIGTTKRGLLVTRFDQVSLVEARSILMRGTSRDGLWLIEQGKISKSVKNLVCTESALYALNNIEQLGVPQRVFRPPTTFFAAQPAPAVVPALKIKDFSFTALDDAV